MMTKMSRRSFVAGTMALAAAPLPAFGQSFPSRAITIVCPQAAGGGADTWSRLAAERLQTYLDSPVVVENRVGASTMIGAEHVAQSRPDGHTLLMGSVTTLAINVGLFPDIRYDPRTDFIPLTIVTSFPLYMTVTPKLDVHSVPELIAYAKEHPGELNYGAPGAGTSPHLTAALFASVADIDVMAVPYAGAPDVSLALKRGDIHFAFSSSALPDIESGELRGIGVSSLERTAQAPDIPTIDEQGLTGFESSVWNGLVAPAGTPADIVAQLEELCIRAATDPVLIDRVRDLGGDTVGNTSEEFAEVIRNDIEKWSAIIEEADVKVG